MGKKRTNPHKIPISFTKEEREKLVNEASVNSLYYAWLLVLPVLLENEGMGINQVADIWDSANNYAIDPSNRGEALISNMAHAETLMGYPAPYKGLVVSDIKTKGELESFKRKLHRKAVYSALSVICLGMDSLGAFSTDDLQRIFLNANISLAEIEAGCTTYEQMSSQIEKNGIILQMGESGVVRLRQQASEKAS